MEQKSELEASLSQCHRENNQLASSVSAKFHTMMFNYTCLVECSRTEDGHSGTGQELS